MSLTLECPHCHNCHSVEEWNEEVENSIRLYRANELIPTDDNLEWDLYSSEESSLVDCPSCGQVCNYEDMTPV